jgi:hypothetical protein
VNLWDRLFRRQQRDEELDEEVQAHLQMAAQERMERGETAEQARASAIREFGNVALIKEMTRDTWGFRWLEEFLQDLRYGLRQLRRNPGFTTVCVITLALGIGANTAIFSVVSAVLFRALPFKNADRLVVVWENNRKQGWDRHPVEGERFFEWVRQNHAFEEMAASNSIDMNLSDSAEAERIRVGLVTSNYFSIRGIEPALGRAFLPTENWREGEQVVILSRHLWQQRFGADPNILGRAITLEAASYTIVGVMPAGFYSDEQAWIPYHLLTSRDYSTAHDGCATNL